MQGSQGGDGGREGVEKEAGRRRRWGWGGRGKVGKREKAHLRRADAFLDPARLGVGMDHRCECGEQRGRHLPRQGG